MNHKLLSHWLHRSSPQVAAAGSAWLCLYDLQATDLLRREPNYYSPDVQSTQTIVVSDVFLLTMRKNPVHSQTEHQIFQIYLSQFVCIPSHRVHNLYTHGCVQSSMQWDSEDSVQVDSWWKSSLKEEREPEWSSLWLEKKKLSKSLHEEQTVGFTSIQTSSLSFMTSVFSAAAHRILTLPPVTDTTCRQSAALCWTARKQTVWQLQLRAVTMDRCFYNSVLLYISPIHFLHRLITFGPENNMGSVSCPRTLHPAEWRSQGSNHHPSD